MKTFEYTILYLSHSKDGDIWALNQFGAEGWEPALMSNSTVILRRELHPEPQVVNVVNMPDVQSLAREIVDAIRKS